MKYNTIHFEALGKEALHLDEEMQIASEKGLLPSDFTHIVTPMTLQDYLQQNPGFVLPDLITTKTHSKIPESFLEGKKKSIITRSAGYDHFEHLAQVANITSLREYCVNAVAQTAIKFLFATAGCLNEYTQNTLTFERNNTTSFKELNENTTVTVFGAGKIGKKTYDYINALGLKAQAVDIRRDLLSKEYGNTVNFVSKEEAIATSDVFINVMNLTRNPNSKLYNVNYFSDEFFANAKDKTIFINVTRGEIAPEATLMKYYKSGKIAGIGVDVFSNENEFSNILNKKSEPKSPDSLAALEMVKLAEERTGNIYVQAHQGFNSDIASISKACETFKHIVAYYNNNYEHFDSQLPYYSE